MSATEFEQQVAEALAAIPHGGDCPMSTRPHDPTAFCCENCCGRRARTAARVAAAIQAAHDDGAADGWGRSIGMAESALPALRGEP